MNAIDLLKADHERVKTLLTQLSESTERGVKKRTELLAKLEMEITLHTQLEEEILYPAFRKAGGKEQDIMYHEAKEEHNDAAKAERKAKKDAEKAAKKAKKEKRAKKEKKEEHEEHHDDKAAAPAAAK